MDRQAAQVQRLPAGEQEDARDFTQEFFTRLLARNAFAAADPAGGRFRTWLLAALKHFLANEWDRARVAQVAQLDQELKRRPDDPGLLAARGLSRARLGRFPEAADDYAAAIGGVPSPDHVWLYQGACLRLYLGDEAGYRDNCRQMLEPADAP